MNWKETLAAVAPTIATALGGPLAGMAVKMAASQLGIEPGELESAVISGDPEVMLSLKQAEQSFLVEMEKLGIERDRLVTDDRQDAREMAKVNMWPQIILSTVFIIGYFILAYFSAKGAITPDPMMFGIMTAAIPMILQFWFGSSHGSKGKDHKQ